ncbi:MAG: hypothetical protein JNL28_04645 [Planctomycetes bacterium]|nr:hypothetical protein [Planctomycetota bacterium]
MSQHAELTPERWSQFDRTQQILQVAVEMHRARRSLDPDKMAGLRFAYERVLRLTDLTIQVQTHRSLRHELLRWRDVIAELYLRDAPDRETHEIALRVLLRLDPGASPQVQYLCV